MAARETRKFLVNGQCNLRAPASIIKALRSEITKKKTNALGVVIRLQNVIDNLIDLKSKRTMCVIILFINIASMAF